MHAALAGPLLAALLATARARPQPPDGGQCRPPGSQTELNSFLWTIRREPPAYLFGTIHVPYTRVWDFIPDNSKAAFQASARVYFELDLTDPYTVSALASCQLLPHGENLQDVLPQDLYWRLKRHLDYVKLMMPSWMTPAQRGKGLYADYLFNAIAGNWERKRPVWVMLMVNSLTETDVRSRGVPVLDLYLAQQAEKMKKSTGAVERVEEQCHPLNGLNFSQEWPFSSPPTLPESPWQPQQHQLWSLEPAALVPTQGLPAVKGTDTSARLPGHTEPSSPQKSPRECKPLSQCWIRTSWPSLHRVTPDPRLRDKVPPGLPPPCASAAHPSRCVSHWSPVVGSCSANVCRMVGKSLWGPPSIDP
uniref:metalloprotease TIKI2-like isoform X1 n=2 Tax=Phocidae TaxID=9709 RepID=UPI00165963C5|nr:metalloprotease TIKI2-like isoform X1 [Halichoerus grypus]